jgi:hypothetical protein
MRYLILFCFFSLSVFAFCSIYSCRKENLVNKGQPPPSPPPPITTTYLEEFVDISLLPAKGWAIGEYSQADTLGTTGWIQGDFGGTMKGDTTWYGFAAYSYRDNVNEYAYSYEPAMDSNLSISSWMLTPVLTVNNGDSISFYTRGDTTGVYTNRMQVLVDTTASAYIGHDLTSVGNYTVNLLDINPTQAAGGYPTTWTRYEYTFTGFSGKKNIRIGFRHYVLNPKNARGIGIDQFRFGVQ